MKSLDEIQEDIVAEFSDLDDWMDRYQLLIDMGADLPTLDPQYKTDDNLIDGCQSRVWIVCQKTQDGTLHFLADSDAMIVKGIIALLLRVFDNQRAEDILNADLFFIRDIGLQEHLSPTRANGLVAMITHIRTFAQSHIT